MKKLILLLIIIVTSIGSSISQETMRDVVYLKNGSIIKGIIVEQIPNVSIKIKTADDNIFKYNMEEVEKITKEDAYTYNRYSNNRAIQHKSPGLAFLCSFLIPGLGQMVINEQYLKGTGMLVGCIAGSTLMFATGDDVLMAIGSVIYLGTYIWSMVDAPVTAAAINRRNGLARIKIGKGYMGVEPTMVANSKLSASNFSQNFKMSDIGVGLKLSYRF